MPCLVVGLLACGPQPKPEPSARATRVAVGGGAAFALTDTGQVRGWGRAWIAGLETKGRDGNVDVSVPTTVPGLESGVADLSIFDQASCALMADGTVKCWGGAAPKSMGDAAVLGAPTLVPGLSGVTQVAVGGYQFACALIGSPGGVKCWGDNLFRVLGEPYEVLKEASAPHDVPGMTAGVKAISAGLYHVCALMETGKVRCWSHNEWGTCGTGATTPADVPSTVGEALTDVVGLDGVVGVTAGAEATVAVLKSGAVKVWGNVDGMGDAYLGMRPQLQPADVPGLAGTATAVSRSCAVIDGEVSCWGRYPGNGTIDPPSGKSVRVSGLVDVVQVAEGPSGNHCAVTKAGAVKCWGPYSEGELGDGTTSGDATAARTRPVAVLSFP